MQFLWNSLRLVFALTVAFLAHPFFHLRAIVQGEGKGETWKKEWLRWGSAWALRILHVKVEPRGRIPEKGLLVSNHQGYLDILCLNVLCPSTFVAKAEIKSWPLFGLFWRMERNHLPRPKKENCPDRPIAKGGGVVAEGIQGLRD